MLEVYADAALYPPCECMTRGKPGRSWQPMTKAPLLQVKIKHFHLASSQLSSTVAIASLLQYLLAIRSRDRSRDISPRSVSTSDDLQLFPWAVQSQKPCLWHFSTTASQECGSVECGGSLLARHPSWSGETICCIHCALELKPIYKDYTEHRFASRADFEAAWS